MSDEEMDKEQVRKLFESRCQKINDINTKLKERGLDNGLYLR